MLRLRVVRWTNSPPSSRSSAAMRRLTVVLGMPSRRAAAVKLGDADGIDRGTQMFIPIRFDGQCFAIRELEARDVHRQTGRVRADLAGLCAVAVAAFVTPSRVNRLEFDRELAGNERSNEIAQPMAEPFTELTGKRRLFG